MDASERQRRIAEEAAEWWLILQDEASRPPRERYVDWLRESSTHVAAMLRIAQVHGALEQFQRWSAIPAEESTANGANVFTLARGSSPSDAVRRRWQGSVSRRVAVAAVMCMAATIAAVLLIGRNDGIIHTERGERREVALADGSVVQVDPETRLRVKYEKQVRRVYLDAGRALFHVAKNSERPFLVQANGTTVRAVGTAFAVEEHDNESLLVTVAEGTVAVSQSQAFTASPAPAPRSGMSNEPARRSASGVAKSTQVGDDVFHRQGIRQADLPKQPDGSGGQVLVTAGQQISVASAGGLETVRSVDSARALAWAEGRLVFDNSTVTEAVIQFNRYNRIQIIVNDKTLPSRLINGTFNAADPESFAAFMQSVARVRIGRNDRADITIDGLN